MLEEPPSFPDRIFEAGLQPISRPNVNFARSEPPILYTGRTTGSTDFHERGLGRRSHHIRDSEIKARAEPIITATPNPTSINWWPYPPWGQSTILSTPSNPGTTAAVSSSPAAAVTAVAFSGAPTSITITSLASSIPTFNTPRATGVSISAPPPLNTFPSNPRVHTATNSHFNMLYLIPILIAVILLGALSGLLSYLWYSRRLARKGGPNDGRGGVISPFVSGPPYIPMNGSSHDLEAGLSPSPATGGSPSKYTRHGTPHSARPLLSIVTGASSRHSSTRSNPITPSQASAMSSASPSHLRHMSEIPTSARSRRSTVSRVSPPDNNTVPYDSRSPENTVISPESVSLSDDDNTPYETIRHKSIRRGILERLQRGISRGPSRRTVKSYLSAPSVYSGTNIDISRAPSFIIPSSSPPPRVSDWTPGSGFRMIDDLPSPPRSLMTTTSAPVTGLPGRPTSAWDNGAAIRQAAVSHPGDRWLAWTRNWVSSPPISPQDRFTPPPVPRRAATMDEKRDVVAALPHSPPQVTSGTLHETLTFSPSAATLVFPHAAPTTATAGRRTRGQSRAHLAPVPAARVDSGASIIPFGEGRGTPAMRYAARKTAHSRVEDILARSYSSRDLEVPVSPGADAFGVRPALASTAEEEGQGQEDVVFAAGIMQRLAVADVSPTAISVRDLVASPVSGVSPGTDPFGVWALSMDEDKDDAAFAAGIMQRLADADVSAIATDGRHRR
jgi:hypothetical protein